jgi:4-diphosphocytidyl-2-C-methyl-D-erythritol kinase
MQHILSSFFKINLSLFVGGRRPDGRHDLYTFFVRLGPLETLTIRETKENNVRDLLFVRDASLSGENLLARAAALLRREGVPLPSLEIDLVKRIPPGSGVGGGSGNAAAFLRWAERRWLLPDRPLRGLPLGADVPFLTSGARAAHATGLGEILSPVEAFSLPSVVLAFPRWGSATGAAYAALDAARGASASFGLVGARERTEFLLDRLARGKSVGLLPNDFLPVAEKGRREYEEAFEEARGAGAAAWGLSGSGSAFFALADSGCAHRVAGVWSRHSWVAKITVWE